MKIDKSFKLEKCLFKSGDDRFQFQAMWFDAKKKTATATNGVSIVTVPADFTTDTDTSGWITQEALKISRDKKSDIELTLTDQIIGNVVISRPSEAEHPCPPLDRVRSKLVPGDTGTATIALNPRLLLEVCEAMGIDKGTGVVLTFELHSAYEIALQPAILEDNGVRATLAPVSLPLRHQGGASK